MPASKHTQRKEYTMTPNTQAPHRRANIDSPSVKALSRGVANLPCIAELECQYIRHHQQYVRHFHACARVYHSRRRHGCKHRQPVSPVVPMILLSQPSQFDTNTEQSRQHRGHSLGFPMDLALHPHRFPASHFQPLLVLAAPALPSGFSQASHGSTVCPAGAG